MNIVRYEFYVATDNDDDRNDELVVELAEEVKAHLLSGEQLVTQAWTKIISKLDSKDLAGLKEAFDHSVKVTRGEEDGL